MDEPLRQSPTTVTGTTSRRPDQPRAPRSFHESLEQFGGAWLAASSATAVALVAVAARVLA